MKKIRCAIYTRKSSEDGLEQEFNSLDAQREACAAFVASQKIEGWVLVPDSYDDGGLSGGTLSRPALQKLLADIRAGKVDQVVVYKIDRLTRSLSDFAKIVDTLDAAGASFVSVTQSFNTATSMGRLTLNMLLSFAQFEREVTAERIRDKIAASKRKGLWMGGNVPLGYAPEGRTLTVVETDARIIRTIYDLYERHGTIRATKLHADKLKLRTAERRLSSGKTRGGTPFSFGHIHHILTNPIYAGRIRHKSKTFPGQHPAIIVSERWDILQERLKAKAQIGRSCGNDEGSRKSRQSPLAGKLFDETGDRLTPSHTKSSKGQRLRYYVSHRLVRRSGPKDTSGWRLPAPALEEFISNLMDKHLSTPAVQAQIIADATSEDIVSAQNRLTKRELRAADSAEDHANHSLLDLIKRVQIAPGLISVALSSEAIADLLDVNHSRIAEDMLLIEGAFQHRKRGVETKLILTGTQQPRDKTLVKNIALAHRFFEMIQDGKMYSEIAVSEGVSRHRIQKLLSLAFLAPDITRAALDGTQPIGLTTERLVRHPVPALWHEQRDLFAIL